MLLSNFDPPANLTDLDGIAHQRQAWSDTLSFWFTREVTGVAHTAGAGKSQFYNPHTTDTALPSATQDIQWNAFPQLIANKHPGNHLAALQEAETLVTDPQAGTFRPQDEYCEWFVTHDPVTHKVLRVDFTCEGPEFWTALAQGYPEEVPTSVQTAGAKGDPNTVLALYRQFISPQVQMTDLFQAGVYIPQNKWNTTEGAMHLTHPANTLQAEINIAAQATLLRAKAGVLLTDQDALICCAGYGVPGRASDPTIGGAVNALAREGASITLQNPVGLYIDSLNTVGWTTPDNTPAASFWSIVRGVSGMGLRAVFTVPAAQGYTVSDIQIGGQPIQFGGQIAEHITMKLTGLACRIGASHDKPHPCLSAPPPGCQGQHALFAAGVAAAPVDALHLHTRHMSR